SVCCTSSSRQASPVTTVMPRTSVCEEFTSARTACISVPPGPAQSWSMITLRFSCAGSGEAIPAARISTAKRYQRHFFLMEHPRCGFYRASIHDGARQMMRPGGGVVVRPKPRVNLRDDHLHLRRADFIDFFA